CRGAVAAAVDAHAAGKPLRDALTGPVARGDQETVDRHLEVLREMAPEKVSLTLALSEETVRQRDRRSGRT
ncbi:MAG TPA: DUF2520 domain-containing protein, partial [Thermoanaerobaculia bacterium]|nr:DUF2520 domain-containing protein [Thermoanaerobaculia bacterium]